LVVSLNQPDFQRARELRAFPPFLTRADVGQESHNETPTKFNFPTTVDNRSALQDRRWMAVTPTACLIGSFRVDGCGH
jgi:hypothetical protein